MLCSEDDWVINTTLICSRANSVNRRPLNPVRPTIPPPMTLMILMAGMEEIPLMGNAVLPLSYWITVPENCGLNVFRITMGIFLRNAGIIVGG